MKQKQFTDYWNYGKITEENEYDLVDYEIAPIDADVLIVDEVSMVDIFLMNHLLKGVYDQTKLILVGDVDQLPSVGAGSVLKDMIDSQCVNTIVLCKIFRQASKSMIILNAHRVNHKQDILVAALQGDDISECTQDMKHDFYYYDVRNEKQVKNKIIDLCKSNLSQYGEYEFLKDVQILSPTKKGILGTKELNMALQEALNPEAENKCEKKYGQVVFRAGDKVMQVKNNYDIVWERTKPKYEYGTGVFNGDLGTIIEVHKESGELIVQFDDGKNVIYETKLLEQLEHAYAVTIHKSQGSEYKAVIIPIMNASAMLLTKNLLYTAITRAKELLILIGDKYVLDRMIENDHIKRRNTGLMYLLSK